MTATPATPATPVASGNRGDPRAGFVTAVELVGMAHVVCRPIALVREPVLVTVAE
jgi:hypothetical protein